MKIQNDVQLNSHLNVTSGFQKLGVSQNGMVKIMENTYYKGMICGEKYPLFSGQHPYLFVGEMLVGGLWPRFGRRRMRSCIMDPSMSGASQKKFNLEVPGRVVLKTCGKIGGPKYQTTVTSNW